jgi:hypothetical protein
MADRIEVTVTLQDKRVTIEGPEDFVRGEVQRLTNLAVSPSPSPVVGPRTEADAGTPNNEREFVALKKPTGHAETVVVLAYWLTQAGQQEFTAEDIRRAYARANVRPPKVIDQSLRDAKNVHDFLGRGSNRGTFRLTPHGTRTVEFDMPRKDV